MRITAPSFHRIAATRSVSAAVDDVDVVEQTGRQAREEFTRDGDRDAETSTRHRGQGDASVREASITTAG